VVKARQLAAASFPAALSGYANAIELKATTALSSLANGDYAKHITLIEGYRTARLGWGASGAQSLAYAFQYWSPRSATIFAKLSNSDRSRCYYDEKAVVGGWNFVIGTVPGDTSGTWNATNGIGLRIEVFSAGKAASPATAGAWGSTNTTATTNSTQNNLSATNDAAVVTGLIVLPGIELPTSARAPFVMRPFDVELLKCRRYLPYFAPFGSGGALGVGASFSTSSAQVFVRFEVPTRVAVTDVAVSSGSHFNLSNSAANPVAATGVTIAGAVPSVYGAIINVTGATGAFGAGGQATQLNFNNASGTMRFTGAQL
jgi:hypothetical protein